MAADVQNIRPRLLSILLGLAALDLFGLPVGTVLLAWGLDKFSVGVLVVLAVWANIHGWREDDVQHVTQETMRLSTASGVEGYLKAAVAPW